MSAEPQHLADLSATSRPFSVSTNARQLSIAQIVKRGARILAVFLAARLLGVQGFGVYALILTVVEMVAVLSGTGYMDFLTREIAKQPLQASALTLGVLRVRLVYTAPLVAFAALLMWLLRFPAASITTMALLSLSLVPRLFGELIQGFLKGLGRFAPLPWAELSQGAALIALVITLLAAGWGIRGVIVAEIASAAIGAGVLAFVAGPSIFSRSGQPLAFPDAVQATWPFSIFPFIGSLYDRADVVVLSKLAGSFATGVYAVPYRIYASFIIIPASVMGAWLPVFSASERPRAVADCRAVMKLLLLATLSIVLFTIVLARPLVLLVLGAQYQASISVIKVLVWALPLVFWSYASSILLMAFHQERIFVVTSIICSVFNLAANIILIPRYSYMAAATVTVCTELLLAFMNCYFLIRRMGALVVPSHLVRIVAVFLCLLAGVWTVAHFSLRWPLGLIPCAVFLTYAWTESKSRLKRSVQT